MGLTREDEVLTATIKKIGPGKFHLEYEDQKEPLGFIEWDDEVRNLDADARRGRRLSSRLSWRAVELTPSMALGPSPELVSEALQHVTMCFCDQPSR